MTLEEELVREKKKIDAANKVRIICLVVAAGILALIYFGDRFYEGIVWYERFLKVAYNIVIVDIIFMVLATFTKFFFVTRYNRIIKKRP